MCQWQAPLSYKYPGNADEPNKPMAYGRAGPQCAQTTEDLHLCEERGTQLQLFWETHGGTINVANSMEALYLTP